MSVWGRKASSPHVSEEVKAHRNDYRKKTLQGGEWTPREGGQREQIDSRWQAQGQAVDTWGRGSSTDLSYVVSFLFLDKIIAQRDKAIDSKIQKKKRKIKRTREQPCSVWVWGPFAFHPSKTSHELPKFTWREHSTRGSPETNPVTAGDHRSTCREAGDVGATLQGGLAEKGWGEPEYRRMGGPGIGGTFCLSSRPFLWLLQPYRKGSSGNVFS